MPKDSLLLSKDMEAITFTIEGLGQKVSKSIPADTAAAWLAVNNLPDVQSAVEAIVIPIVRAGEDAKAKASADAIIAGLKEE